MILPLVPLEVPFKAGLTKDSITKLYNEKTCSHDFTLRGAL